MLAAAVYHQQYLVGLLDRLERSTDALLLHYIVAIAQPSSVSDMQWHAIQVDLLAEDVAGGTGNIRHNGRILACQCIQQAGFASIGFACNNNRHTVTDQSTLGGLSQYRLQLLQKIFEFFSDTPFTEEIDFLIGEVDGGFQI